MTTEGTKETQSGTKKIHRAILPESGSWGVFFVELCAIGFLNSTTLIPNWHSWQTFSRWRNAIWFYRNLVAIPCGSVLLYDAISQGINLYL